MSQKLSSISTPSRVRKGMIIFLLISCLFYNTSLSVFAASESVNSLDREIDKNQRILENLGNTTDRALEKIDSRISDPVQSERIEQKQAEIQELVDQAQEVLEDAQNKKEIQVVLQETKNIIAIKVESAVIPTTDITDTLSKDISIAKKDLEQAKETLIESFENENRVRLIVQTSLDEVAIRQKLEKYDNSLGIDFQFDALTGEKVYEISIHKGSLLEQELLPNTETGEIPKSIFGIGIVQPELFTISKNIDTIEDIKIISSLLEKESLDKLWGIRSYGGISLFERIKNFVQKSERKVRVAIIDTGIASTHIDLTNQVNMMNGYDFINDDADPTDDQGHGTHVAGTIAGNLDGQGIVGINPWAELTALKICDNKGFCPSYAVIKALTYAKTQNYDVINMSLGARGNPATSPICSGIQELSEVGTIVVAAAGNSNVDTSTFVPGGCANAVTVAAVDQNMKRASFSNYGAKVDVSAPGVAVYSSYLGGGYKSLNGTSMATPHIVGLASIARLYHPNMTGEEFKTLIKNTKLPINTETNKSIANFVNIQEFLNALSGKQEEKKDEKIPAEKKDKKSSEQEKQEPPTQTRPEDAGDNELKVVIDESIGLEIQKDGKMEINSVGATEEDRIEINNTEEKLQATSSETQEAIPQKIFTSDSVEINTAADPIDFSKIDYSKSLKSEGNTKTLYGQEKTTIVLSDRDIPEGYTAINSDTDEEYPVSLDHQNEPLAEEGDNTAIQNTYTCSVYVGYTCTYSIVAGTIRKYNMSNTSIASVSAGNSSFTVTGLSAGSTTLYVNYAGRTIATVYINVQKRIDPINVSYGANRLEAGSTTYLTVNSGNGGYSVSSSNSLVVYVSGNNTNWTLSAINPGTATITYQDSAGQYGTINITVTAPPRNLSISIGQTSLEKGKTTSLSITDGNGGYSVSSSNTSVVSIAGGNTIWTLSAVGVGTSTISVRDSRGKVANVNITVTESNPIRNLWLNYNPNPHHIGRTSTINITDGNGGYTVTSSDPNILTVSGNNTNWTITAKSPGHVTVTVQDQRGMTVRLPYTVLRQIKGTLSNVSPFVGQTATFTVTDGNGGYTLTSSNPSVATVRQTTTSIDTHYTITALSAGETTLTIRDKNGSSGWIKMTVRIGAKPLTVDTSTLTVEVGSDAYFRVTSGNGGYSHAKSNNNVGWYSVDSSIPSYRVRGVSVGSTVLQITDSAGKIVQVRVEVVAKKEILAGIKNIEYSKEVEFSKAGVIRFETYGDPLEVGVEYIKSGGSIERVVLAKQSDSTYMVGFEKQSCESCNNFRPYVILKNSGRIVYAIGSPIVVSYIPFLYFGYLDGDSSSNIASAEDESANNTHSNTNGNIEINSTVLGVNDPLLYLLSGYVKTKKKLTDIREKYGSTTSLVVSLFPGVGEGYDIITLLKGKDPITGEKLTTIAKGFTIIGLLSGIGSGKLARDAAELAVQKIAKELGVTVDEVKTIAKNILDEYDLSNIEDLIALKNRFTKDGKLSLDEFWKVVREKIRIQFVGKLQSTKGFGKLENHFNNHGIDFGAKTKEEYLALAESFAKNDNPRYLIKINIHRDSIIKYDPDKNIFISVNNVTNEIRTFFKPIGNGLDYFNKQ